MFEKAARLKLRFVTPKGRLSVEDLFVLPLTALDAIYQELSKSVDQTNKNSLLKTTQRDEKLELRMKIVEHIFNAKVAEAEEKAAQATKAERKKAILAALASKQADAINSKSIEELTKELEAL